MSLSIAIIGLPNVGKSTLFNALVKNGQAEAKNYPFCTIDPNIGIVEVPDNRLKKLAKISKSEKIIPTIIEFVDIAGLVSGASRGEGLGNKFLANIRECDAICEVIRVFFDSNVTHVAGKINPENDIKTIETELELKDLETLENKLLSIEKDVKSGDKKAVKINEIIKIIKEQIEKGNPARELNLKKEDIELIKELGLLTLKPIMYVVNVDDNQITNNSHSGLDPESCGILKQVQHDFNTIPLSAKIESEINELADDERKEYLDSFGVKDSGLNVLVRKAYNILGLETFFTSGEKETRAWTIKKGATAQEAASVIHSDFARGFIAAEVIKYNDFINFNGWAGAREKGLVKTCGKDYVVSDGDVIIFRFNV